PGLGGCGFVLVTRHRVEPGNGVARLCRGGGPARLRAPGLRSPASTRREPIMPAPVPVPIRRALARRAERGATAAQLSRDFGLPPRTVRALVQRWRQLGDDGLEPSYRRASQPPPEPAHPAYRPA